MRFIRTLLMSLGFNTTNLRLSSAKVLQADFARNCFPEPVTTLIGTTPTLPISGDATELPATNLALQYVAIGRGTQNYTCKASNSDPVQLGAAATLFDATTLAYDDTALLHSIPPIIVYLPLPPLVFPMVLGNHYFDQAGTPVFNLSSVDRILYGMKAADIAAPSAASKGPAGTGAIDWLQLSPKPEDKSVGLSLVYRVVTAGGAAPNICTVEGVVIVQYAAEYWFYA
ncbi:uncharacterized protein PAC_02019 [Phialocephala subalpina]|uniref:Malate dehydrogenase n=1 Tax=Phialocephala subalpina TaxID=576137 RepID=A0A1L7WH91_9HELO|nr:uncharacterized protein PAC_02019 [Phialocephala subalpina]